MKNRHKGIPVELANHFFKQMEVFDFSFMQEVASFMELLRRKRIPLAFALECIERKQEFEDEVDKRHRTDHKKYKAKGKKCPRCGQLMALQPIYEEPGSTANLKGYRAVWYCTKGWHQDNPEGYCGHHAFTTLSMNKILRKMGIKTKAPTKDQMLAGCPGKKRGKQNAN